MSTRVGAVSTSFSGLDGGVINVVGRLLNGAVRRQVADLTTGDVTDDLNERLDALFGRPEGGHPRTNAQGPASRRRRADRVGVGFFVVAPLARHVIGSAPRDAVPALPIPTLPLPAALASFGFPAGATFAIASPEWTVRAPHAVLLGAFALR